MTRLRPFFAWACLALGTAPLDAADLTKVERTIAKEPAYQGKPKYCLLVFGPEAKSRVWLVLDGDTLYADRNGNGDLTEKEERFKEARPNPHQSAFLVGELALPADNGSSKMYWHLGLDIFRPAAPGAARDSLRLSIRINTKDWTAPVKEFSDRPQDAPILHFDGPATFLCPDPPTFVPGKTTRLVIYTGTAGLGDRTFAWRNARSIVGEARLLAEIEYPSKDPGGKPLYATITLPLDPCCGGVFEGPVQVPAEAGVGQATITLLPNLLPARTVPNLTAATIRIPVVGAEGKGTAK